MTGYDPYFHRWVKEQTTDKAAATPAARAGADPAAPAPGANGAELPENKEADVCV